MIRKPRTVVSLVVAVMTCSGCAGWNDKRQVESEDTPRQSGRNALLLPAKVLATASSRNWRF